MNLNCGLNDHRPYQIAYCYARIFHTIRRHSKVVTAHAGRGATTGSTPARDHHTSGQVQQQGTAAAATGGKLSQGSDSWTLVSIVTDQHYPAQLEHPVHPLMHPVRGLSQPVSISGPIRTSSPPTNAPSQWIIPTRVYPMAQLQHPVHPLIHQSVDYLNPTGTN